MRSLLRSAAVTALASGLSQALLAANPDALLDQLLERSGLPEDQRAPLKAQLLARLHECEERGRPQRELLTTFVTQALQRALGGRP